MADEDFDIDSLAAYLHLTPSAVNKLASRGKIPGRKVGGQWKFSRHEIHHWLEGRIGLSDEDELENMEIVLNRHASHQPQVSIAEMLKQEAIAVPLVARTRSKVITAITDIAANTGLLWDPEKAAEAIRTREEMQPTALDNGIALLHPRRPMPNILGEAFLALGITPNGIPFGNSNGYLTDIFFTIFSVDDQSHLRTLARLSRILSDDAVLASLREAPDAETAWQVLADKEATLG